MAQMEQIMASAGSGKTYTLTERYLRLLVGSQPPATSGATPGFHPACTLSQDVPVSFGDILAITFTNAAANEMRNRILKNLKKIAIGDLSPSTVKVEGLDSDAARRWIEAILLDFGSLNIRTIDSLLLHIVHAAALELNLHPDFEPEFSTSQALETCLDGFMEGAWLGNLDSRDRIRQLCKDLVIHKDVKRFCDNNALMDNIVGMLDSVLQGKLEDLTDLKTLDKRLDCLWPNAKCAATEFFNAVKSSPLSDKLNKNAMKALDRVVEKDDKDTSPTFLTKDECSEVFRKGTSIPDEIESLYQDLSRKYNKFLAEFELLNNARGNYWFVDVTRKIANDFMADLHKHGKVPTLLIPSMASRVMSFEYGVPDLICRLGTRFAHFLLDEFQDTSLHQWEVLKPLVEESLSRDGSLTCVGDIKQCIYEWRDADPELFIQVFKDPDLTCMVEGRPTVKRLENNYRSSRQIVQFNNKLFNAITQDGMAEEIIEWLTKISGETLAREAQLLRDNFKDCWQETPEGADAGGFVKLEAIEGANKKEQDEALQERLCRLLLDELQPRWNWKDILVLVRSNAQASAISQCFLNNGIEVITENSLLLAGHTLVQQLVALLRFVDDPDDDIAFLTVLRGSILRPWLEAEGLSEDAIEDCVVSREWPTKGVRREWPAKGVSRERPAKGERRRPLAVHFSLQWPEVWKRLLAPFLEQAHLVSCYDVVQEWMKRLDVEGLARKTDALPFVRRFLEVLYRAEDKGVASISEFLQQWKELATEEKLPMPEDIDAVRVRTIHKAKGLESGVVIVSDTGFDCRDRDIPELREYDGMRLAITRTKLLGEERCNELRGKQARENMNLLYVALTRAKEELYVFRAVPSKATDKDGENGNDASAAIRGRGQKPAVCDIIPRLWERAGFSDDDLKNGIGSLPKGSKSSPSKGDASAGAVGAASVRTNGEAFPETPSKASEGWRFMDGMPELNIVRNPMNVRVLQQRHTRNLLRACVENLAVTGEPEMDAARALAIGMSVASEMETSERLQTDLLEGLAWFASRPEARWLTEGKSGQYLSSPSGKLDWVHQRTDLLVQEPWGTLVVGYELAEGEERHLPWMQLRLECLSDSSEGKTAMGVIVYFSLKKFRLVSVHDVSGLVDDCGCLPAMPAGASA